MIRGAARAGAVRTCRLAIALGALLALIAGLAAAPQADSGGRGTMLIDFEDGTAALESYEGEDFDPNDWEIQSQNTYGGTDYALRMWGNTWKQLSIDPYPLSAETVFQVAIYTEDLGELHAFAFGDSTDNVLFYCVSGEQLVLSDRWNVAYQGAFPLEEWHAYRLPIGQDWYDTWGYLPRITRLVFVNDHDDTQHGKTVFDEVYDVTADLPVAPTVEIQTVRGRTEEIERGRLYRVEVQFQALVYDPDSDAHTYAWDFGDGTTSAEENPVHSFTAEADYTFTVALDVRDDTGLFGRDTVQVTVEPTGESDLISINFTGDIFMGRNYDEPGGLIDTYGVEYLFEPTLGILGDAADVTMVNAECPFTDQGEPHPTKSVVFRTRPENIAGLVYAGIDVASLGNNHITDYGIEGLVQTEAVFDSVGITRGGSGINSYFALQPCYYTQDGVRMGFINYCNRTGREYNYQPFLDAGYEKCGFGYWLQPNIERAIAQAESVADIVIAFPHTGLEYQTAPPPDAPGGITIERSPELCPPYVSFEEADDFRFPIWPGMDDRQMRWHAVDTGADAVLNSHPHVLQGFEVYNGALIAHSLGNFMFDLYYPETMPTIVLRALLDKEGIRRWTYKPVFIDQWIPVPAAGRLGREILDRLADYSRELNTLVGVDPEAMTGLIFLDPAEAQEIVTVGEGTGDFVHDGGWWVSRPIAVDGAGSLSKILGLAGVPPEDCEICWGREVLWFGRFEQDEEGHHMWNLNSSGEWIDDTVFYEGAHSLALYRDDGAGDNVVTLLGRHLPAADSLRYNINGWMKTEDAAGAKFSLRFYRQRYTWNEIDTYDMGAAVDGDSDWTRYARDAEAPDETKFFNVRCNLNEPSQGEAFAWFDDLRVAEWLPWQPAVLPLEVPYPNNFRFVQVRVPYDAESVTVSYEETRLSDNGFSGVSDEIERRDVDVLLSGISPNPFRGQATLRYRLSGGARVSLEIFDINGRRIAQLASDEWKRAGWHRVRWESGARPAGVYLARLTVNGQAHARKMVLIK